MIRTLALTLAIGAALALPGGPAFAAPATPPAHHATASKAQQLDALYQQYWAENLKLNPIIATFIGDARYNDQLPNFLSADYRKQTHAFNEKWLHKVGAIDPSDLSGQDRLSYDIFMRSLRLSIEGEKYPDWMMPVSQFDDFTKLAVLFGSGASAQPFQTVKDYDNWAKRGSKLPAIMDTAVANMREGMKAGVVMPKALMVKTIPQLDAIINTDPTKTQFWAPIEQMPASFSAADKQRITAEYRTMIATQINPAYTRLRDFIQNEYLPAARDTAGMGALPNGAAWYAYNARVNTTTDLTPAQIHEIGLKEVARIHAEMEQVKDQVGFKGDLQAFFHYLDTDPKFTFKTKEDLLQSYHDFDQRLAPMLAKEFRLMPKAPFEIRPVEPFREKSAAGGQYFPPSADGSRPGIFYANTYDLPARHSWETEDLFLHEAKPGHHFQIAIQQEVTGLPMFRRFGGENAFAEGWGLYAETIGRELGALQDPYQHFGELQNELWRAIRLVVDTGLHSQGWTREQVIQYMRDNSAVSMTEAVSEAERYMAIPGQALAYKIGQMKITELRARAQAQLGDKFDIRDFHDEVLRDGAIPLSELDAKIDRWIAAKKAG